MIVADASALCAVILREDDAAAHEDALMQAGEVLVSAVKAWETAVQADKRRRGHGPEAVDVLLMACGGTVVPIDDALWRAAVDVQRRWGRPHSPAGLTLGDCFAYALAESRGLPLLYKGKDFPRTGIASVL